MGNAVGLASQIDRSKIRWQWPALERIKKTTWKEFLAQHWEVLVAVDFFTAEVWTRKGLQRFVVLFFI